MNGATALVLALDLLPMNVTSWMQNHQVWARDGRGSSNTTVVATQTVKQFEFNVYTFLICLMEQWYKQYSYTFHLEFQIPNMKSPQHYPLHSFLDKGLPRLYPNSKQVHDSHFDVDERNHAAT